jgi:hypothetical protein
MNKKNKPEHSKLKRFFKSIDTDILFYILVVGGLMAAMWYSYSGRLDNILKDTKYARPRYGY